jgi:hypothetical protein
MLDHSELSSRPLLAGDVVERTKLILGKFDSQRLLEKPMEGGKVSMDFQENRLNIVTVALMRAFN